MSQITRHFTGTRRPRGETGASDAIGSGLGVIVSIAVGIVIVSVFGTPQARAWNPDMDRDSAVSQWFKSLMQPDNKTIPCCGKADAYWADIAKTDADGNLIAVITDDRDDAPLGRHHVPVGTHILVPKHKIKWDQGNPTGHIVVFLSDRNDVYCYVQNGGA